MAAEHSTNATRSGSVGVVTLRREPTDEYGLVRFELHYYPNGRLGDRNDYQAGSLYLRQGDWRDFVSALEASSIYAVEVVDMPSYAQMSGPERS